MKTTKRMYGTVSCIAVGAALLACQPVLAQSSAPSTTSEGGVEEVIVTGFRSSLAKSLNEKRAQTVAVDTIQAEDVGKFPDSNLSEAMQRLPGVALSRGDGGEGRTITVRGLAASFTRVRINGMEGSSQSGASDANGGATSGRSFAFNIFPSEIFSSLAVRKTASADTGEGSLGATVDLAAPRPLNYGADFVMTGSARGIYNDVARKFDPKASALISKQFANGTFGLLGSIAYNRRRTRDVGYSAVLVLPPSVNGGFCTPIGVTPQNPANSAAKGTNAQNCSTGNPRTGSVTAYNAIQARTGISNTPGGGAFFPRLPRYLDSQQDANRLGGTLTAQWKPDDNTNVSLDTVYSRYDVWRSDSYISGLSFARSASNNGQPMTSVKDVVIDDKGSVVYGLYDGVDVRSERWISEFVSTFKQATLNFDHRFTDHFKVTGLVGLSSSKYNQPSRGWFNIDANDVANFSVDFRGNNTYPTIKFGSLDVSNPNAFAYAPGAADGTVYGTWSESKSVSVTDNKTAELNGEWDMLNGFVFKVGGQYRENYFKSSSLAIDPANRATQQLPAGTSLSSLTLQVTGLDKLLGYGAPASFAAADRDKFRKAIGFNDSWYCGVECGAGASGVRERVGGGYGMVTFNTEDMLPFKVRGDAGVRYVHTDQFSYGNIPIANPAGSRYPTRGQRVEASRTYDDWLPAANVVVELKPDLLLRMAAAKVMSRPELGSLTPSSGVDAVGRRGSINNPNLDPIRAKTYDASLEWYFAQGSLLSVAYFRKDIATYIQSISSLIPFNQLGLPDTLLANSQTQPTELFTINRATNTPGGVLQGVELNAQAPLRFLPGFLSNFGVLGSVTLVSSKIDYILQSNNGVPTLSTTDDLIGLSRNSASGTLYYEDKKFSARVTGNYRSRYINTIPSGALDSDYIANSPSFYMDFQASYQLTPRLKVVAEGQNLTNEDSRQYIDSVRQDSLFALSSGRTFTIGADFKF
jgi:iron complex outermembrane receptor protein